jgi:hypothetical protein
MQGGDISNETPPRFLFVFEGLIGKLPEALARSEQRQVKLHRYTKAATLWEIDDQALSYMWDMAWRHHLAVDIVTFLPYHEELRTRLDEEAVPYGNLRHYASPDTLAVRLAYMPYVARIYFAWPERQFIFGDRGVFLDGTAAFNPLGM